MNIGASLSKCREYKPGVRHAYHPVTDSGTYTILIFPVSQCRFGESYRTDGTEQIFINLLRFIQIQIIFGLFHHIINIMENQNQIIARISIIFYNHIIKCIQQFLILQLAFPQSHQKLLLTSRLFFLKRKFQIQNVIPNRSGKHLLRNIKILEEILLLQIQKCFSYMNHLIVLTVHITATHPCECTAVLGKTALQFVDIFFIHYVKPPCLDEKKRIDSQGLNPFQPLILLCFLRNDLSLIVGTTSFAYSVRHH